MAETDWPWLDAEIMALPEALVDIVALKVTELVVASTVTLLGRLEKKLCTDDAISTVWLLSGQPASFR
jgi:hypothetical protein